MRILWLIFSYLVGLFWLEVVYYRIMLGEFLAQEELDKKKD